MPLILPIVGAHYRPPAKLILAHLRPGTELHLQAEPQNPYDENAIMVLLPSSNLPQAEEFWQLCEANFGLTEEDLAGVPIHLGYIPRTDTHLVHPFLPDFGPVTGTFTVTAAGKPAVTVKDTP